MRTWLRRQRSWLVVEPVPAYGPNLGPVEALWASRKAVELANPAGDTLAEVTAAAKRGVQRMPHTHHLLLFLRTAACPMVSSEHVTGTSELLLTRFLKPAGLVNPADIAEVRDRAMRSLNAFVKDDRTRAMLYLQAQGYRQHEIAEILGVTEKAVEHGLARQCQYRATKVERR
jgi:hypothetical protein